MPHLGKDLYKAIATLESNGLVAIPTETVYGLAANAYSIDAVLKIFEVKKRPSFDPLIVHVSNVKFFDEIAEDIPDEVYKLAAQFCPGPITFILKKKYTIPDLVTSGQPTVGVRIPRHPLTLLLLENLQFPLAAPSANPFGYVSPTTAKHVQDQLGSKIDYILDGGSCRIGLESTIVDFSNNKMEILRLGGLSIEDIEEVAGRKVDSIKTSSSQPKAPGMLSSHYSPGCPLYIIDPDKTVINESDKKPGYLLFGDSEKPSKESLAFNLSASGSLEEAARNLFKGLRFFAENNADAIYTSYVPNIGLGKAINDRLKRASVSLT